MNLAKYKSRSFSSKRERLISCSHRTSQGRMVCCTNSIDWCSMFENVAPIQVPDKVRRHSEDTAYLVQLVLAGFKELRVFGRNPNRMVFHPLFEDKPTLWLFLVPW